MVVIGVSLSIGRIGCARERSTLPAGSYKTETKTPRVDIDALPRLRNVRASSLAQVALEAQVQDIRYTTLENTAGRLNASDLEALVAGIRGEVLTPRDGAYDAARKIWNGMVDRRPAVIVRCSNPQDVRHAVNFAREHRMLVSVRGGGHHIAGNSVAEGGLVIDQSGLRTVRVDPERRV